MLFRCVLCVVYSLGSPLCWHDCCAPTSADLAAGPTDSVASPIWKTFPAWIVATQSHASNIANDMQKREWERREKTQRRETHKRKKNVWINSEKFAREFKEIQNDQHAQLIKHPITPQETLRKHTKTDRPSAVCIIHNTQYTIKMQAFKQKEDLNPRKHHQCAKCVYKCIQQNCNPKSDTVQEQSVHWQQPPTSSNSSSLQRDHVVYDS